MKKSDLKFDYPHELVALKPVKPSRVVCVDIRSREPKEITLSEALNLIPAGDVLVINDTKVLKRRVFAKHKSSALEIEILFLEQDAADPFLWTVLFPAREFKVSDQIELPNGALMTLVEKGLPQKVKLDRLLSERDFDSIAELPLPPYIQKARGERHNEASDQTWYQTDWAKAAGSFAAPTASLHFSNEDLEQLKKRGVLVLSLTLHVGLGTFLPVKVDDLNDHKMHEEIYSVPSEVWNTVLQAKKENRGVWALGTTVTRTLESVARTNQLSGASDLLLQPGSEFKIVNRLLTNFHQPESTLLALVAGFCDLELVRKTYAYAIDRKMRLFSYGDLSIWIKPI